MPRLVRSKKETKLHPPNIVHEWVGMKTVEEIEECTRANRNTIKVHVKKLAEQHIYGRSARDAARAT